MDYWRCSSRKLFAAKSAEFSDLSKKIERNRKRLSRKRDEIDDDEDQLSRMESTIDSVSLNVYIIDCALFMNLF